MTQTTLIIALLVSVSFSASAEYMVGTVAITVRNETQFFFDVRSLAEIAENVQDDALETATKLSDFFTSTSFHFEANGRYTTLKNGYYSNSYIAPAASSQKNPIFEIEVKVTPSFIRAYAQFMGTKMQNLLQLANIVHSQIQNPGSPYLQIAFNNFYTCLRSISVSPYGEVPQFQCFSDTIRSLGLKDERSVVELANTYMVLYRASRLSFQSSTTINVEDEKLKQACRSMQQTLHAIQMKQSRMIFIPQPGYLAMVLGRTSEWDSAVAYYIATPRVTDLMGPYVTARELPDKSYLETDYTQRRICLF